MPASFPTALPPSVTGTATPSATLANAGHATALHQKDRDEIIALGTKVGLGTGVAATGVVLVGTGAGTSAWQAITSTFVSGAGVANTVYGPSGYTATPSVGTLGVTGTASITGAVTAASGVNVGSATGAGVGQLKTSSHIYVAGGLNVGTATSATAAGNGALSGGLLIGTATGFSAGTIKSSSHATIQGGINVGNKTDAGVGQISSQYELLAGGGLFPGDYRSFSGSPTVGIMQVLATTLLTASGGSADCSTNGGGLWLLATPGTGNFGFVIAVPYSQAVTVLGASPAGSFVTTDPGNQGSAITYLSITNPGGVAADRRLRCTNRWNAADMYHNVQKWGQFA